MFGLFHYTYAHLWPMTGQRGTAPKYHLGKNNDMRTLVLAGVPTCVCGVLLKAA